jgi:YHS domain-containing protein
MWGGFMEGLTGEPRTRSRVPQRGVQMVRDPVCGTFVVPERAVTLVNGRTTINFCSEACRDKYRARTA